MLCKEKESISAVCRALGINRQQFARYLAGTSLPKRGNLVKICTYFGVSEGDLFADPESRGRSLVGVPDRAIGTRFTELLARYDKASIASGAYWCDLVSRFAPTEVVRTVLLVGHERHATTFRRLTNIGEKTGSRWRPYQGRHEGIALERRGTFFFAGINTHGLGEPSLLTLKHGPSDKFLLAGTASLMTKAGSEMMAAVVSPVPRSMSLLATLRQSRCHRIDTPDISLQVIDLLEQGLKRLR